MGHPLLDLTDKTAVVIGGTSGIGLALTRGLAQAGANVVPTGRRAEQVRNARNVEHQTVGAIERDERRIARAGVREALEQFALPDRIGVAGD